jgi:hypothetical protein
MMPSTECMERLIYSVFIVQAYLKTMVSPGKSKFIYSVITWSVNQTLLRHRVWYELLLCSVLCLHGSCESMSNQRALWTPDILISESSRFICESSSFSVSVSISLSQATRQFLFVVCWMDRIVRCNNPTQFCFMEQSPSEANRESFGHSRNCTPFMKLLRFIAVLTRSCDLHFREREKYTRHHITLHSARSILLSHIRVTYKKGFGLVN